MKEDHSKLAYVASFYARRGCKGREDNGFPACPADFCRATGRPRDEWRTGDDEGVLGHAQMRMRTWANLGVAPVTISLHTVSSPPFPKVLAADHLEQCVEGVDRFRWYLEENAKHGFHPGERDVEDEEPAPRRQRRRHRRRARHRRPRHRARVRDMRRRYRHDELAQAKDLVDEFQAQVGRVLRRMFAPTCLF